MNTYIHKYIIVLSDPDEILEELSHSWLLLELKHTSSKTTSNEFWSLATKMLPRLAEAQANVGGARKIPQFRSIREKLYDDSIPAIKLEVAYLIKETGDILVLQDLVSTPVKKFPPSKYTKLYESAKVDVS